MMMVVRLAMTFIKSVAMVVLVAVLVAVAGGCGASGASGASEIGENEVFATRDGQTKFRVETVADGLEVPWGFAFLPNGDILFTERPGRVRLIAGGKLSPEPVFRVPDVEPSSESGLMDISLHPQFSKNSFVYLAYAYRGDGKQVKVVRYRYDGGKLVADKTVVENIPAAPNHAGTRARFGPDGKLYVTTGDATDWELAQKMNSLAGKTLRLNDDGSVPEDNPFVSDKRYRPEVYTVGHRNAQGLAWSAAGVMYQNEHGPSGFEGRGGGADEVNLVERGRNYGWPVVYGPTTRDGYAGPIAEYSPACAPGGLAVYEGGKFPSLRGSLLMTCLRGARIVRLTVSDGRVTAQENLLEKRLGRLREIASGPDGLIYFSTSNRDGRGDAAKKDDRIMRLVPVE